MKHLLPLLAALAGPADGETLLVIQAHPDDEATVAAFAHPFCHDPANDCVLVTVTNGSNPVRSQELQASANYLGMANWHYDFPGGNTSVEQTWKIWTNHLGGEQHAVVHWLMEVIENVEPDYIITFDSRHGTGGHPEHLVIGSGVASAAYWTNRDDNLYLQSAKRHMGDSYIGLGVCKHEEHPYMVSGWNHVHAVLSKHPSQFPEPWLAYRAPMDMRYNVFVKWTDINSRQPVECDR